MFLFIRNIACYKYSGFICVSNLFIYIFVSWEVFVMTCQWEKINFLCVCCGLGKYWHSQSYTSGIGVLCRVCSYICVMVQCKHLFVLACMLFNACYWLHNWEAQLKKKLLSLHLLLAWNWVLVYYVILNSAREMSYRQWKRAGCCQVLLIELYSAHKSVIALAGITDVVPWAFLCL